MIGKISRLLALPLALQRATQFGLLIVACWLPLSAQSTEWQELQEGETRIAAPETENVVIKAVEVPLPEGHYEPGQGTIDSAFGFVFGEPISDEKIDRDLGWQAPAELPLKLKYVGIVKPFTMHRVKLLPPAQPPQLKRQSVSYRAFLNFDQQPLVIETSSFDQASEVIEVIQRKYGTPDKVDGQHLTYHRGDRQLHVFQKGNSAFLRYEDLALYTAYMSERNRSLKRKFREDRLEHLSPEEKRVVTLGQQLEAFRLDNGTAFGLPFGKRVSFRAVPDEFVTFDAPKPLEKFVLGQYKIMVSPDLLPIAVRYELTGEAAVLVHTKEQIELAMELAFAGFQKQTPHHSVVSFNHHAYSILIRSGKFQFTIHDRQQNRAKNDRDKQRKIDAHEADEERERIAELERQRQAIAARLRQIEEEKAF
ncbi:MAG: hypothetical protein ACJA0W_003099 [Candidatus Azotimanducaceae bacterium]